MTPRFLIDRGTATVSAALVAPLDGRWRLLASAAFPALVELEAVLGYVADRAAALFADMPETADELRDWRVRERIETSSAPPRRIAIVAPAARRASDIEAAALQAGWQVAARLSADRHDALAVSAALADPTLDAIVLGGADPPRSDERRALEDLAATTAAIVARRPEVTPILSGAAVEEADRFPFDRVVFAPAASPTGSGWAGNELTRLFMALGGEPHAARLATARSIATMAAVFDRTVEWVDVGASGGAWFRAVPPAPNQSPDVIEDGDGPLDRAEAEPDSDDGRPAVESDDGRIDDDQSDGFAPDGLAPDGAALEGFVLAAGAMVPERPADDEEDLDAVIGWSPLRIDRPTHRDRLRDLRAHPWQDAAGDGALLRMAAGRAALARLEGERVRFGGAPAERMTAPDLLVVGGGAFALAPGSATALAAADTVRRPGMTQIAYDHARLLAPLGTLDEAERRTMIADLADELLLPIGSVLVLAGGRPGHDMGRLFVESDWATEDPQPLQSGALRLLELPPGAPAKVELEVRDGRFGRTRVKRLGFQTTGGLAGLLVDTRDVPLRLPARSERRREVVAQWQRSLWPGAE